MQIVINADDLGMDENRNLAIIQCLKLNYCTQTSIVVNCGESTEQAVKMVRENNLMDKVALHINLTIGEPLSEDIKSCPLYCKDGKFSYDPWLLSKTKLIKVLWPRNIKLIRIELEAQINAYLNYGFKLCHVDSHNWVHLILPIWLAFRPLIKKYSINSIRGIRPGMMERKRWKYSLYYRIFNKVFLSRKEIKTPYASNIYEFIELDKKIYENIEYTELFTHPILLDGELVDNSRPYTKYPKETMLENIKKLDSHTKISFRELHIRSDKK